MRPGVFYGVGVGPGDPELMTLKAFRVLKNSSVIAVPKSSDSSSDGVSQALTIIKKEVDIKGKELLELLFPMTKDKSVLRESRLKAASLIAERLKEGKDTSFITLGDPMLYSTFSYLVPYLKEIMPDSIVKVIPGVTSFSAAASATATPLAESGEKVIIIPAAYDIDEIRAVLKSFDTVILMKVNKAIDKIIGLINELGLQKSAFFVSRASWPEEEVVADINSLKGRKLDYFSMVIIKKGL